MASLLDGVSEQLRKDVCNLRDKGGRSVFYLAVSNEMRYLLLTGDAVDERGVPRTEVNLLTELGRPRKHHI